MQDEKNATNQQPSASQANGAGQAGATAGSATGAATGAAGATAESPADTIARLQAELAQEQARYADLFDRYQRAAAEFQNSRRRQEKQMAEAVERASSHVVRRLLPVLDDLDLAFASIPAAQGSASGQSRQNEPTAWVDGFRAIQKKLHTLLEEEGVRMLPLSGPFDPTRHEAVSSEANDSVESGHIIATLRPGYELNGAVLRPALVRVAQ